jgi:fumarate reductase subunit C
MLFYGIFVLAVAVHAPIGLRTVIGEVRGGHGRGVDAAMLSLALLVLALGLRAVAAVTTVASS